jgi:pimeloyl-ACP methyl ester carboxylesterase
VNLYYVEKGSGEPVVLVHGVGEDYRIWNRQIDSLSEKYRVLSYSRRFSTPNSNAGDIHEDTMSNNTNDLLGFITSLGIAPIHLVGHSYGGSTATYFASKHSEKLRSLVLIEPAVTSVLIEDPNSALQRLILILTHPSFAMAVLRFTRNTVNPAIRALKEGDSKRAAKLFVDGIQTRGGAFEKFPVEFQNMVADNARTIYDFEILGIVFKKSEIAQIRAPTLIIKGETSTRILRDIADSLHKIIPNSEEVAVDGSGHFPQFERPEALNEKIGEFLIKHSS